MTTTNALWSMQLPTSRHDFGPSQAVTGLDEGLTYGDYFTAVRNFLMADDLASLSDAVGRSINRSVAPADMDLIAIYLVKHGAFYHPAYVTVDIRGSRLPFVVNVAISAQGRQMIDQEYHSLNRLNAELGERFWPNVLTIGQGNDLKGRPISMFLGQWLDGYHEFHLSGEDPACRHVAVWDTLRGRIILSRHQSVECLRQAACILSYAYNPLTFEAVRHWHPAAGDFVVALNAEGIALRLITVRDYAPMIDNVEPDVALILETLLVFWMEISLKLRLDRLDGIGRLVCHGDDVVPAICRGFFEGLESAAPHWGLPEDFGSSVHEFFAIHDADRLRSIAAPIIEKMPLRSDERDLMEQMSERHIALLLKAVVG